LLDLMNAGGEPSRPVYRLDITLTTEKTALATRSDASVSLSRLTHRVAIQIGGHSSDG
jgi:hypothetical protein